MRNRWTVPAAFLVLLASATGAVALADAPGIEHIVENAQQAAQDPGAAVQDPQGTAEGVLAEPQEADEGAAPPAADPPAFADRVREAFGTELLMFGLAGTGATLLGLVGFALVTRYISPKEALSNPQRAMLYGYVRGHPGVHLKQLSEEFAMKTSSILWHLRKLESADLTRSERANGYRVFYPVDGGIEIKRVSRAITALHNENAQRIYNTTEVHAGSTVRQLAERLGMHGGTVRWHLRKLREFGLVEELVRDDGSRFFPTPLGRKALETLQGSPVDAPAPRGSPLPTK